MKLRRTLIPFAVLGLGIAAISAEAQSPRIYGPDGTYLGNLNRNQFDPNSVSNPYGQYGSNRLAASTIRTDNMAAHIRRIASTIRMRRVVCTSTANSTDPADPAHSANPALALTNG